VIVIPAEHAARVIDEAIKISEWEASTQSGVGEGMSA
jgi:regulator of RNase E activity RraA